MSREGLNCYMRGQDFCSLLRIFAGLETEEMCMQSINGYLRGKRDTESEKKPRRNPDWEPDSMELEQERARAAALNLQKGIFDRSEQGLNQTQSVFEQTAVFHVDRMRGGQK